jgi:hypothetical protein
MLVYVVAVIAISAAIIEFRHRASVVSRSSEAIPVDHLTP